MKLTLSNKYSMFRKRLTLSDTPPSPQMYVLPPDITPISPLAKRVSKLEHLVVFIIYNILNKNYEKNITI